MRANDIKQIAFSSTGSIMERLKLSQLRKMPTSNSNFLGGASKLASEGLIAAYCEGFNFQSWILDLYLFWVSAIHMAMFLTLSKAESNLIFWMFLVMGNKENPIYMYKIYRCYVNSYPESVK